MLRSSCMTLLALCLVSVAVGCDAYDPPPESELQLPEGGVWYPESPLVLEFDRPVIPETLVISIWSRDLDLEGDLTGEAESVAVQCSTGGEDGCGDVTIEMAEDGLSALIHQGGGFKGREGRPHVLIVHSGLTATTGRARQVDDWFDFQVTPNCQGGNPIEVGLQSSMMLLISDMTELVPGVYLRIYFEILVDPSDGKTWLVGTLADVIPGASPNATDPASLAPKLDATGWMISLEGWMDRTPDGELCLRTTEQDVQIQVLGLFDVVLENLRIEATLTPGTSTIPDAMEGFMTSSEGQWGIQGEDLNGLGQVGASVIATGVDASDFDPNLGAPCDDDPCAPMTEMGGLCYLPDPWVVPAACP